MTTPTPTGSHSMVRTSLPIRPPSRFTLPCTNRSYPPVEIKNVNMENAGGPDQHSMKIKLKGIDGKQYLVTISAGLYDDEIKEFALVQILQKALKTESDLKDINIVPRLQQDTYSGHAGFSCLLNNQFKLKGHDRHDEVHVTTSPMMTNLQNSDLLDQEKDQMINDMHGAHQKLKEYGFIVGVPTMENIYVNDEGQPYLSDLQGGFIKEGSKADTFLQQVSDDVLGDVKKEELVQSGTLGRSTRHPNIHSSQPKQQKKKPPAGPPVSSLSTARPLGYGKGSRQELRDRWPHI